MAEFKKDGLQLRVLQVIPPDCREAGRHGNEHTTTVGWTVTTMDVKGGLAEELGVTNASVQPRFRKENDSAAGEG